MQAAVVCGLRGKSIIFLTLHIFFHCPGAYYYAQQVSRHDSRSTSPPHTLKVIMMGCMKSRWDLQMTGSDREPQTGHPLCLPADERRFQHFAPFLPVIPSPLFLVFLFIYLGLTRLPFPHYYALLSLHLLRHRFCLNFNAGHQLITSSGLTCELRDLIRVLPTRSPSAPLRSPSHMEF